MNIVVCIKQIIDPEIPAEPAERLATRLRELKVI
jgi:hypothetical protein